ncbi:MAG: sigma 54-interacting transcriptional regulator [Deltaproteobacteria bacterium]|jgi:two-component system response regulator AtoC
MSNGFGEVETIKRGTSASALQIADSPGRRLIVFGRGPTRTIEVPEEGQWLVGRAPDAALRLDDGEVSRAHARVTFGRSVFIEDLESANGTLVRLEAARAGRRTEVRTGDAVQIGPFTLVLLGQQPLERDAHDFVIASSAMQQLYDLIDRIAVGSISVLIFGETGVGKEVTAEAVHLRSRRRDGPFVRLNCAALTESIIESELFGYEKGAFTGAVASKRGLIEAADGGTLFLDEIGELPLSSQVKLLRVLEERRVRRVGALESHPVDVRIVAATNRDLEREIAAGSFREDLYFRLNGMPLEVPPLRLRKSEIAALAERFVTLVCTRDPHLVPPPISTQALAHLERYDWPGNIRELRNVIERAVLLAQGGTIEVEHVPLDGVVTSTKTAAALPSQVQAFERDRIVAALAACDGNQTQAAERLGIARRTLINRLDQYDIERPRKGR